MPGKGLPTVSGRKGLRSLTRDYRAGFGATVAVGDRNTKVIKKLQHRRLRESAADKQGAQFAAKGVYGHSWQEDAAKVCVRCSLRVRSGS